jgi:phosphinothricin acetyltransferase
MENCIRFAKTTDAPGISEIYAPFVNGSAVTFEEEVPSGEEIASRMEQISEKLPYLVCEIEGKVAGYAYACDFRTRSAYRWTKELSVYVHPSFRRKNIAVALYGCVIDLIKLQGITSALACITVPNPESVGFHEQYGFKKVGIFRANGYKLGQWHDVGWWELDLNPERVVPWDDPFSIHQIPEYKKQEIFRKGMERIKF